MGVFDWLRDARRLLTEEDTPATSVVGRHIFVELDLLPDCFDPENPANRGKSDSTPSSSGQGGRAPTASGAQNEAHGKAAPVTPGDAHAELLPDDRRPPAVAALHAALQTHLLAHPSIDDLRLHPGVRRISVRFSGPVPVMADVVARVQRAKQQAARTVGIADEPSQTPPGRVQPDLPDDLQLEEQRLIEVIAAGSALASGIALRVVPLIPRSLGTNLAGALYLVAHTPRVRAMVDERLGKRRAELSLNLALSAAQSLSQRPMSAAVDLAARWMSLRELRARRELWETWGPDLSRSSAQESPAFVPPRARVLPDGPIEQHAARAWKLSLAAFGISMATTRNPARAVAALFSALPQPARLGRELFATELGRVLARRGALVLAPRALRRLDRIDCLVLPADLVSREQFSIGRVLEADGSGGPDEAGPEWTAHIQRKAHKLFDPDHPLQVQRQGTFSLGPPALLPARPGPDLQGAIQKHAEQGMLVSALTEGERFVALVEVRVSAQTGASTLLAAARDSGIRLVLTHPDPASMDSKQSEQIVPSGPGLVRAVRRLQEEDHTVCCVTRGDHPALPEADLGVGLWSPGQTVPWSAEIMCPDAPSQILTLVQASRAARAVSQQSVRFAMGAAALGTIVSAGGLSPFASRRVMFVVNGATMLSMLNGTRRSAALDRHPLESPDPTPWHALDARGVLTRLGKPDQHGRQASRAHLSHQPEQPSALRQLAGAIKEEFFNPLAPLLAAGAGLSAAVGSMADATMVAGVGGVNAVVGGVQRYRTERAIHKLTEEATINVRVRRDDGVQLISQEQLARGDLLLLEAGDVIPADCRILDSERLEVDGSSLTGESLPVLKSAAPSFAENIADRSSMLYAGSTIAGGRATAIVVALGTQCATYGATGAGGVHGAPEGETRRGGVEQRMSQLMRLTGPVVAAAGAGVVLTGMVRGRGVQELVSTGVSLAVAAVPEGLPLLATAAQLSAAERLSRRGTLVRNPRAIEALGRVNVICLDKTGTLTEGRIELDRIHDGVHGESIDALGEQTRFALRAALWCGQAEDEQLAPDQIDAALNLAATRLGLKGESGHAFTVDEALRFESTRGFQAVLGYRPRTGTTITQPPEPHRWMVIKGAPEQVIPRCLTRRSPRGSVQLDSDSRTALMEQVDAMAVQGLRVIAVAARSIMDPAQPLPALDRPDKLELLGLLAFRDPPRPSARDGVGGLRRAGIRLVMITGDHPSTAAAIASDVGLLQRDPSGKSERERSELITGAQLARLNDDELDARLPRLNIFARVTPAQKVRVVRALQRGGAVVGMVGDGANDAPALRLSDAGVAIGAHCTPAARSAADIMIADPRIDALLDAVVEGRAMWISVRDAVSILVGGNLGEIGFTVAAGALSGRPPLSPRQLLLVNFLTDIAPAMAIALRPPRDVDLSQLAREGPEISLSAPLNRRIASRAIATATGAGSAWLVSRLTGSRARARTIGLAALVGSQLGQTLRSGGLSRPVLWTSLGSAAVLGSIIQMPGLSQLFGCRPLGPVGWSIALGGAVSGTATAMLLDPVVERIANLMGARRAAGVPVHDTPQQGHETGTDDELFGQIETALHLLQN